LYSYVYIFTHKIKNFYKPNRYQTDSRIL